jgi:hypothetical protein
MLEMFSFGELTLPGLPTTVALAIVATIGYLIGRFEKPHAPSGEQLRLDLERALGETRQLEQIADDVLQATRSALAECRRITVDTGSDHGRMLTRPAPKVRPAASQPPRTAV